MVLLWILMANGGSFTTPGLMVVSNNLMIKVAVFVPHLTATQGATTYCQALSISQSLYLYLSLRDRDRADTIITLLINIQIDLYSSVIHHLNRQLKPY